MFFLSDFAKIFNVPPIPLYSVGNPGVYLPLFLHFSYTLQKIMTFVPIFYVFM